MTLPRGNGPSKLRVGGSNYSYLWAIELEEAFDRLAGMGYRCAEMFCSPPHVWPSDLDARHRKRMVDHLAHIDLEIYSLNTPGLDINLASPNPNVRAESVRYYRDLIDLGADLHSSVLVVLPGKRHKYLPAPYETAMAWSIDGIKRLAEHASHRRLRIAIEQSAYNFTERSEQVMELLDRVDDPSCGILIDVANAFVVENVIDAIHLAGERLMLVHLSDAHRTRWAHGSIGSGQIDFVQIRQALIDVGFDGVSMLEVAACDDPDTILRSDLEILTAFGWRP